jgi:MoaA/NifB/PqqE/SkfB family radical SAM enzyme
MGQILSVVEALAARGLRGVIFSGGGEPLLYPDIEKLLDHLCDRFDIGVITNGTMLHRMDTALLNRLTWVRVSTNTLDYVDTLKIPAFAGKTTLGFSYIWNERSTPDTIDRITKLAVKSSVNYIRLVPDCTVPTEQLEQAHVKLHALAEKLGPPWFHQYKIHKQPVECHLGRIHPVLYADGLIYPCDSLVLNSPRDDRRFRSEFAMCRWDEVAEFFDRPIIGSLLDTSICPHCIFTPQNDVLIDILNSRELPGPECKPIHVNFV